MVQQKESAVKKTAANAYVASVLAFLLPGAGHLYLHRYKRAGLFFVCVVSLAMVGALVSGEMHSFLRENAGDGFLQMLAAIGNIGLGLIHLVFHIFGLAQGNIEARGYEYGTTFIIIAALVNVLVVLDAWDIAKGKKQ